MVPASVLNALFCNIQSIYDVNREFFSRIEEGREKIVTAFLTTAPYFKVYSAYAYGYKHIINMLEVIANYVLLIYFFFVFDIK